MKNILESPETMSCYAQIDYCYYMIEQMYADVQKPLAPIEHLIDITTGYSKERIKKNKDTAIELLKTIIDCKKKIEADYSNDEKVLKNIKLIK